MLHADMADRGRQVRLQTKMLDAAVGFTLVTEAPS